MNIMNIKIIDEIPVETIEISIATLVWRADLAHDKFQKNFLNHAIILADAYNCKTYLEQKLRESKNLKELKKVRKLLDE